MSSTYYMYILLCADGTYYTGITIDIVRRIDQHNGKKPGGAKYTRVRRPVKLVYSEMCSSRSAALQREYLIKKLTRTAKEALLDREK